MDTYYILYTVILYTVYWACFGNELPQLTARLNLVTAFACLISDLISVDLHEVDTLLQQQKSRYSTLQSHSLFQHQTTSLVLTAQQNQQWYIRQQDHRDPSSHQSKNHPPGCIQPLRVPAKPDATDIHCFVRYAPSVHLEGMFIFLPFLLPLYQFPSRCPTPPFYCTL